MARGDRLALVTRTSDLSGFGCAETEHPCDDQWSSEKYDLRLPTICSWLEYWQVTYAARQMLH